MDASTDGGHEGGMDASVDGGNEAGSDAGMMDGGVEGGMDGGMTDAGMDSGTDAGPDGGMDGGMEGGVDGGVSDGGSDGGMSDGGLDADGGVLCTLVNTPSALYVFPIGSDLTIGGADLRYVSSTGATTLTWDTRCDADSSAIEVGAGLTVGVPHNIVYNGHTITITVNSKNPASATATVGIF
jgi:hypothetical protein